MFQGKKKLTLTLNIFAVYLLLVGLSSKSSAEVILQGFHWNSYSYSEGGKPNGWYRILTKKVDDFTKLGITVVWLPPPSASFEGDISRGWPHSRGYLPTEYYKIDTNYGTEAELRHLIQLLNERGIKPVADIVINHRHAVGWTNNGDGTRCQNIFFNPDWGPEVIVKNDGSGCGRSQNFDSGWENPTFLDLDHTNSAVRDDLTAWLKWLRWDVGFVGWRYDQAIGYGGRFVSYYNKETSPEISFGEYWDTNAQNIINWIDETWKGEGVPASESAGAFDFPNREALRMAVNNQEFWRLGSVKGNPAGLLGLWPVKALTFVENHDTRTTEPLERFSDNLTKTLQGYAYILTHPGHPTVFYDDLYEAWDGKLYKPLKELLEIRVRNNIQPESAVSIERSENGLYVAVIAGKIVFKMGLTAWTPPPSERWKLVMDGPDFAIWEKSSN